MRTHTKYTPYPTVKLDKREWADKSATVAPRWVSTDLRDGNQALANPMGIDQKIVYFKALVEFGFKEIEIAYPSASQTEFDFCRRLIEENLIPEGVTIGVLVPSIERHIVRSFEALQGAGRITMHLYNPTASNQRSVVFRRSCEEIIELALEGVECIKNEAQKFAGEVVFEYSPESFSQTELKFARDISNAVIEAWEPTQERPMILNLPNTLEACSPNIYADRIEWMSKHIKNRESVIISVHPHNDRGCAVASAELAVLAGAQRVEGTILGNGERAGNVDLITLAFNYFSQGIDPCLRVEKVDAILEQVTSITGISVAERHPYVGSMIYTAFSGTHQDAIKKGMEHHREHNSSTWEVPYLAIDPRDIGREYKDSIRINSQSGKGGVAYVLKEIYGIDVPNDMQTKLANEVKRISQKRGGEISSDEVLGIYEGMSRRKTNGKWKAGIYAENSKGQAVWAKELIDKMNLKGDEAILDIGCGDGKITEHLAMLTKGEVVGIDQSVEMIAYAKQTHKKASFLQMDAQYLKFNVYFDAVFSNAALHWVSDHEAVVKGIYKALKNGGRALLQMGGEGNAREIFATFEKIIPEYAYYFEEFKTPYTFHSAHSYEKLLADAGFTSYKAILLPKDMVHEDIKMFRGWIETTWFPFIDVIPDAMQEDFIQKCIDTYLASHPLDAQGRVHVAMVRLEVEAYKGEKI